MPQAERAPAADQADGANAADDDEAMTRPQALRMVMATCLPLLLVAFMLTPWSSPEELAVEGPVQLQENCLLRGICAEVLAIGGLQLTCKASVLGISRGCKEHYDASLPARATYFLSPTLLSLLRVQPPDTVLLHLAQGGVAIHHRSVSSHLWRAFYGGWYLYAVSWVPMVAGPAIKAWWRRWRGRHTAAAR